MSQSKQLTIAELILRLGSGVFGVSGLGILGLGCIYLINDTTGGCISFLESIPKMLSQSNYLNELNTCNQLNTCSENNINSMDTNFDKEKNITVNNKFVGQRYWTKFSSWSLNYLRRGLIISGMIGGGVGMRFLGNWFGSEKVIGWFNGKFGSNYM